MKFWIMDQMMVNNIQQSWELDQETEATLCRHLWWLAFVMEAKWLKQPTDNLWEQPTSWKVKGSSTNKIAMVKPTLLGKEVTN